MRIRLVFTVNKRPPYSTNAAVVCIPALVSIQIWAAADAMKVKREQTVLHWRRTKPGQCYEPMHRRDTERQRGNNREVGERTHRWKCSLRTLTWSLFTVGLSRWLQTRHRLSAVLLRLSVGGPAVQSVVRTNKPELVGPRFVLGIFWYSAANPTVPFYFCSEHLRIVAWVRVPSFTIGGLTSQHSTQQQLQRSADLLPQIFELALSWVKMILVWHITQPTIVRQPQQAPPHFLGYQADET